jgi:hypothetical protein
MPTIGIRGGYLFFLESSIETALEYPLPLLREQKINSFILDTAGFSSLLAGNS